MPVRIGVPKTTHQWLKPLYAYLDGVISGTVASGASGIVSGAWIGRGAPVSMISNATGVAGFFGFSGLPQYSGYGGGYMMTGGTQSWSGSSGILSTGIGGSGLLSAVSQLGWNGGTGTIAGLNEIVRALKNVGLIPL